MMTMDIRNAVPSLVESKRILVLGSSGSGKSHFSSRLAELLDIRLVHLDAYFWNPGWIATPPDEWQATVKKLVADDSWIMDGTYERTLPLRIPAAESIIIIDSRRLACLGRVFWRKLTDDGSGRTDAPPNQPIDRNYVRYIWQYPGRTRPVVQQCIQEYGNEQRVVRVNGPRGANRLLEQVKTYLDRSKQ